MKITSLIVKVASRCNLNCTYCYMYNMGDETYRSQPKIMSNVTIENLLYRIKEHTESYQTENMSIVFHGGEPMLTGMLFYKNFLTKAKNIIPKNIHMDYLMQTNGVLLTDEWCLFLKENNISVGISMDSTPESTDKYRVYHNGKGSYADILEGAKKLSKTLDNQRPGFISVVDTETCPNEVYNHFKNINTGGLSFLFPEANYEHINEHYILPDVGKWLIQLFDLWYLDKDEKKPDINPFTQLIMLLLGTDDNYNELFGQGNCDLAVIETNGSIETVDTLRVCGNGFTRTSLNVSKNKLDDLFESEIARKYYYSHSDVCSRCKKCPIFEICGGGYLPHRYSKENGFENPTIYCNQIIQLVSHIQNKLIDTMSQEILSDVCIERMNADEIIDYLNSLSTEKKLDYE